MNNKHIFWAIGILAVLAGAAIWYYPQIDQFSDIFFYQKMAEDVSSIRDGQAPGEPSSWYPPFAAAVFYAVSRIPYFSFVQSWLGVVVVLAAAAWAYLHFILKEKHAYLVPLAILACIPLLGLNVTFARYDILIGLLILLAWRSHVAKRYALSIVWAVLAGGLKAVPFILLPLVLLTIPKEKWRSMIAGLVIGFLLIAGAPALLIGPKHFLETTKAFFSFQGERGFQIESAASGADMLLKNIFHQQAYAAFHHFATHNMDLGYRSLRISTALVVLALLALYLRVWSSKKQYDIALLFAAGILATLFFAPVFSPQFLLWVLPLMLVWLGKRIVREKKVPRELLLPTVLVLVISACTHYLYPFHYREFFEQTYIFNTIVLNVRNIAVISLAIWSLRYMGIAIRIPFASARKKISEFVTRETAPFTPQQKKIAGVVIIAIAVCFIAYICSFKILDRDFWWHIKAGEIMTKTGSLIDTEPFAYTRANQPYLATQSWLAEIFLYGIHAVGGSNAIIAFRTFVMLFVFGLLLWMDKKHAWLTSLLVIFAANAAQPAFIERPQLFTFMIFAACLYLAFQVLERGLTRTYAAWFIGLEILWVNIHGAAALLAIVVAACVAAQMAYDKRKLFVWKPWAYLALGMAVAFFISPSGYHNVTYITQLLNDKTIIFINEWQPRELSVYLGEIGLLWIVVLLALWKIRRNFVFCLLMLLATGYLSRKALRHEVLFIFTAVGISIYQLKFNKAFANFAQFLTRRQIFAGLLLGVSLLSLYGYTKRHYQDFAQQDQLFGYGVFTPAKGAYEFLEKNNITGNMFNTYGIGGYLLNRGYPDRKIYIDGRNVDYGYEFMNATYEAGLDAEHWKKVEDKYQLTYAVIDYMGIEKAGRAGYSIHLDKNPDWKLVYLDDWTAVYLKNTTENKDVIARNTYKLVTPINIDKGAVLDTLTKENKEDLIAELTRVAQENTDGVKANLLVSRIYIADGNFDATRPLLDAVKRTQPHLADTYQLLATIALSEQQWVEAATQYKMMLARTGNAYPDINYKAIAEVFSKAGYWWDAAFYSWLAKPDVMPDATNTAGTSRPSETTSIQEGSGPISQDTIGSLLSGINEDLAKYNDEGAALGEQGKLSEAKAKFMEALKLDPGNPQTLNNLAVVFMQMGDQAAALDYLKRSFERTKEYPDAHYNLAILYYNQKNYAEAKKEAELAQKYGRDSKSLVEAIAARQK